MKFFLAIILSFIVLAETVVPCCLWDNCSQEVMTSKPIEQKKAKGDCSPFASCSTCVPGVVVSNVSVQIVSQPPVLIQHTAVPLTFLLSSFSPSLLQPPRLY